ncbi:MAG TPA: hypothetical protein VM327_07380 [Candidatus Thermoplasmatota archaeon]|nr:hypothetical protein [Candidatus Thermoplasmatota archaeon]
MTALAPRAATLPGALAILVALFLAPGAAANPEDSPPLEDGGLSRAHAALPGQVEVLPWTEGPLCGADPPQRKIQLREETVGLSHNATSVAVSFRPAGRAFVAVAAESGGVVRSLVMMEEQELALHTTVSAIVEGGRALAVRAGTAGVPVDMTSSGKGHGKGHGMGHGQADASPSIEHGAEVPGAACPDGRGGILLLLDKSGLALGPGDAMAHVVVLADLAVPDFLPHPLESTAVEEHNLYLASAGEDADAMQDSFSGRPRATDLAAPVAVVAGAAALALASPRRRT